MTKIEWVRNLDGSRGESWNPIVGCSIVSPGCTNCYAMKMAARLEAMSRQEAHTPVARHYLGTTQPSKAGPVWTGKLALAPEHILTEPLRRKKPTMYFVNSMSDLFHESVDSNWILQVLGVMALTPRHTYQVLTKRASRMRELLSAGEIGGIVATAARVNAIRLGVPLPEIAWPLPNVWLGVSAERQQEADARIPDLLATPAAVRFVSAEPLLGPIDFRNIQTPQINVSALDLPGLGTRIDWIIVGGESGPNARPMTLGWAKDIVRQCKAARVPVFVKQLGAHPVNREGEPCPHVKHKKGADMSEWPDELRVREMPRKRRTS